MLPTLRRSLRVFPEILSPWIPRASPDCGHQSALAVIRARIARVDSPTCSSICCEDNPECLPAGVDKAPRAPALQPPQSTAWSESGSARPRTCFVPSSMPTTMVPPAVLANATMLCIIRSGDDRSRLNSRVSPSGCCNSCARFTTRHLTRKMPGGLGAALLGTLATVCYMCYATHHESRYHSARAS